MAALKFRKEFRHRENAAAERVYPAGWSGEVPDELAAAARAARALAPGESGKKPAKEPAKEPSGLEGSARDLAEQAAKLSAEEAAEWLATEQENDKRKTVIKALEDRIAELAKAGG